MKKSCFAGVIMLMGLVLSISYGAVGDVENIDFDAEMNRVWTQSGIWPVVQGYHVLPTDFSLDPTSCDLNGGFDISVTPVVLFPNNMLDSDELALISAILANPNFNCKGTGGTSHEEIHAIWRHNFAQSLHDLGGGVGGPEVLIRPVHALIPGIQFLFCGLFTLGDVDSEAFPLMLMDLAVNNTLVVGIIGDPNLHVPDPAQYQLPREYLAWCGDADGDGCSNLHEYEYYHPLGGRAAYLQAAMDPNMTPPGCSGDKLCDGSGGLLGEYYNESMIFTGTPVTRLDSQVSFNWGKSKPHPDIDADHFSVCWTGGVTPDYSEPYTFSVRTDDGVRLWVNNELLVDQWNDHGSTTYSGVTSTALTAGVEYPIRMDFYENGGDAVAWLGWESAQQVRKGIYEMYLKPGEGMGDRGVDWVHNPANGHYYRMTATMTWGQGRVQAEAWGGYLATINDAAENTWVYRMFGPTHEVLYLGGNDRDVEGRWVWDENGVNFYNGDHTNGAVVPPWFANWHDLEPNNAGLENALMIYPDSGLWNDLNPDSPRRCLVESNVRHLVAIGPFPEVRDAFEGWIVRFEASTRRTSGVVKYQWKKGGEDILNATNAAYVMNSVRPEDAGSYTCLITDATLASGETNPVILSVIPEEFLPATGLAGLVALIAVCLFAGARVIRGFRV